MLRYTHGHIACACVCARTPATRTCRRGPPQCGTAESCCCHVTTSSSGRSLRTAETKRGCRSRPGFGVNCPFKISMETGHGVVPVGMSGRSPADRSVSRSGPRLREGAGWGAEPHPGRSGLRWEWSRASRQTGTRDVWRCGTWWTPGRPAARLQDGGYSFGHMMSQTLFKEEKSLSRPSGQN